MEIFACLDSMYNTLYEFFINESHGGVVPFKLFGFIHIFLFIITIGSMLVIFIKRKSLIQLNEKTKRKINLLIITVMFLNMAIYYLSKVCFGLYDWKIHLPLHLCFISGFLFMFAVYTKNHKLYKLTYFMAFIGPLPAIIWPELYKTFDSFIFYQYIISHHLFLVGNMFVYCSGNYNITKKDLMNTFLFVNCVFLIIIIFNNVFNTNYIMSSSFPPHVLKLYPFLNNFNYPVILLEVVGLLAFILAYLPVCYNNKNKLKGS